MTIVYDNFDENEPQVHALIIGVGKYPYLPGGDGRKTSRTLGLDQLTSPPVSARFFWQLVSKGI